MAHLRTLFYLLRIPQWSKNAVVFAALVFGEPTVDHSFLRSIIAFVAFCAISSAGYIFNDWLDLERDRVHPVKRFRPMALGVVPSTTGLAIAAALTIFAFALSSFVNPVLTLVIGTYSVLMLAYSFRLKHIVLVDVFVITVGFLLRAVAGAAAVEVPVSAWLMLCTLLLSLFLAFGKRRSELLRLGADAANHRSVLSGYSLPLLDHFLVITAACTVMAYSIYSFTSTSVPQNGMMMLTIPPVMFAVFRYLLLIMHRGEGGAPEILLWRDRPLLIAVIAWSLSVVAVMYTT